MSWSQRQKQQNNVLITAQTLEERINMYIGAMDRATAMNNGHESSQLQQDIQRLVDLMEKISAGHAVTEQEVPPPLVITSLIANPLGELSSRLTEYHKALYFAEEELSEDRMNKIQRLQRGLQTIHELQKRSQAGFPVRADEIPPPVTIPSDDEFDPDAVNTLLSRLDTYRRALSFASQSENDRRRTPKLQSAIRTIEFLLTRAKAKRPVWKKDIPPEYEYCVLDSAQQEGQPMNRAKFTLQLRSLQKRVQNIIFKENDQQKHLDELKKKLQDFGAELPGKQVSTELDRCLTVFANEVETLEKMAFAEKTKDLNRSNGEKWDFIEMRLNEYKTAALASKRGGHVNQAIQQYKIVKALQALKEALEKGESVDMTLVPPALPRELTPADEPHLSLTELNQGPTTEVAHSAVGATAHLSPIIIKPAIESAEDKLAKKLVTYLDKGADLNLTTSKQIQNIYNISVSPAQCLPKIQNTEKSNDNLLYASSNNVASLSGDSTASNNTNPSLNIDNQVESLKGENSLEYEERTSMQLSASHTDDQTAENTLNLNEISQDTQYPIMDNEQVKRNNGQEDQMTNQSKEEINSLSGSLHSSPSKSSDVFVKKTLDTLGFLSCQNVPDHSVQSKADSASSNSMTLNTSHTLSEFGVLRQQDVEVNVATNTGLEIEADGRAHSSSGTESSHAPLPSHDYVNPLMQQDSHYTTAAKSEALPGDQSYFLQNMSNDWGIAGPKSITLPVHGSDVYLDDIENGPSSLPIHLMPQTMSYISDGIDAQNSLQIIPHINRLATSVDHTNISHSSSSAAGFGQQSSNGKWQVNDMTSKVEINNSGTDSSTFETADSQQRESNGRTSPDTLEFLELMDSMVMSSIAAPVLLTPINSSVVELPSHPREQLEPSLSNLKPSILKHVSPSEDSASNSSRFNSIVHNTDQDINSSANPLFQISYTLPPVDKANKDVTNGEVKTNLPLTSKDLSISSNVYKDHLHINASTSISSLTENHQHATHTSDSASADSVPRVPSHVSRNVMNGNVSIKAASDSQLHNSTQISSSHLHSSPSLFKSKSVSTVRQASVLAYSDVAFTCLENLKYDYLLSLAKDTDDNKQEEKKLKAKLELIKNKLRNEGKRTWEVYKACVEREHASLVQQIEDLCLLQQWSDVHLLSEKKSIAERELVVLKQRLPELKY